MTTTRYIVMTQAARVPGALRVTEGQRVALVEVEPNYRGSPAAISARAPGVRRIVRDYGMAGAAGVLAAETMKARLEAGGVR